MDQETQGQAAQVVRREARQETRRCRDTRRGRGGRRGGGGRGRGGVNWSTQKKDLPPHEHSWLSPPKAQHLGQYSVCSHCKTFNLLTSSPIPAKKLIINCLSNSSSRASGVGTIHDLFNICFAVGKTFYVFALQDFE